MAHSQFSKSERDELSILLRKGYSHRQIAEALGKHRSAVDREIVNNSVKGTYDSIKADTKSRNRRRAAKYQNMKINESPEFLSYLEEKLKADWTPEQISSRWNKDHKKGKHFSFKAIYKFLYSAFGQRLCKYYLPNGIIPAKDRAKSRKRHLSKIAYLLVKGRKSLTAETGLATLKEMLSEQSKLTKNGWWHWWSERAENSLP